MASQTCRACGVTVPEASQFCRNCGTSLVPAAWDHVPGNPQSVGGWPAYGGPAAAEAAAPWMTQSLWRQKKMLVMHKSAALPDRCVKCNDPANGRKLTKKYMWHHPAWYLTAVAGLLIYVIVALVVRKQVTLNLGLCDRHYSGRRRGIALSWLLAALGVGGIVLGVSQRVGLFALGGIGLIFIAAVFGSLVSSVIAIKKVDDYYVWLRRIDGDYLAMFPELP